MAPSPGDRFLAVPVDDSWATFTDPRTPDQSHYGLCIRLYDIGGSNYVEI